VNELKGLWFEYFLIYNKKGGINTPWSERYKHHALSKNMSNIAFNYVWLAFISLIADLSALEQLGSNLEFI